MKTSPSAVRGTFTRAVVDRWDAEAAGVESAQISALDDAIALDAVVGLSNDNPLRQVAAVLHQIGEQVAKAGHVRDIADDAPVALGTDEPGMIEYPEMGRHGVLNGVQPCGDLAGGHAFRSGADKQPEDLQACGLAEGGESRKCFLFVHIHQSGFVDVYVCSG